MRTWMIGGAAALLLAGCGPQEQQQEEAATAQTATATAAASAPQALTSGEVISLCPGGSNCPDETTVGMLFSADAVRALQLEEPAAADAEPANGAGQEQPKAALRRPTACPQAGLLNCPSGRSGLLWSTAKGQVTCRPNTSCMPGMPTGLYGWLCTPDPADPQKCAGMPRGAPRGPAATGATPAPTTQ